ncbi:MAG TPA: hypothetical protein VFZ21_07670 [Gemmatimonadaceae bacterium]|nr:hypothetical protein [Gemmatimonadaceae bacterium]
MTEPASRDVIPLPPKEREPGPGYGLRSRLRRLRRPPTVSGVLSAVLVLIGVVLALTALEVRSTRISINASAESVSFLTAGATRTSEVLLRDLAWTSQPVQLTLPDGEVVETPYFRVSGGPMTLPSLGLADSTEVTVKADGEDGRYTFALTSAVAELVLALPANVTVDVGDGRPRHITVADPSISVRGIGGPLFISGTSAQRDRFAEGMSVRRVSFWREAADESSPLLSTLRKGLLVLDDVGGRQLTLREGEPLVIPSIDGVLRSAALTDALVEIQADGRARGLRSGYTTDARSLMPNVLDWLMSIPAVKAILAVIAVLMGSSIPVRRKELP